MRRLQAQRQRCNLTALRVISFDLAAGRGFAALQIDLETVFVTALDFVDDDADLLAVTRQVMQVFDIGDCRGFERRLIECPRVVGVDVASMDAKGPGFQR
jgi:hypothetical protein